MTHEELREATDGALRVARRKLVMAEVLARQANERLQDSFEAQTDDERFGDNFEHSVETSIGNSMRGTDIAVPQIENELDRRGADYKPLPDVADQVRQ